MFIIPVVQHRDYDALKSFCPDLPETFDDWAEQQLKEQQRCDSQEIKCRKLPITSVEFKSYCKTTGLFPNLVTFKSFITLKEA